MSEYYFPYDEDSSVQRLSPAQKEMLKNEITKVRLDAKVTDELERDLDLIPLAHLVENYIEMSVEIIKHMDKREDPVFQEVLQYARVHLTKEEFRSIQIEVYAACNKIAMQQCTPVDKIAHLAIWQDESPIRVGLL